MPSMHQMKFSPLGRRQRPENRMVEQMDASPEAGLALAMIASIATSLYPDFGSHFLHRQTPRLRYAGDFRPGGMCPNPTTTKRSQAVPHRAAALPAVCPLA